MLGSFHLIRKKHSTELTMVFFFPLRELLILERVLCLCWVCCIVPLFVFYEGGRGAELFSAGSERHQAGVSCLWTLVLSSH